VPAAVATSVDVKANAIAGPAMRRVNMQPPEKDFI
jgi:hypothetical protein